MLSINIHCLIIKKDKPFSIIFNFTVNTPFFTLISLFLGLTFDLLLTYLGIPFFDELKEMIIYSFKKITPLDIFDFFCYLQGMNADKQRQQIQRYIFFAVLYKSLQKKLIVRSFLYYELNLNRCCCR
jgi:hypothetical protein